MKTVHALVLAVVVLGTSACASNSARQPIMPAQTEAPNSGVLIAPRTDAPQPTTSVVHSSPQSNGAYAPASFVGETVAPLPGTPDHAQSQKDPVVLHAKPSVRDPLEGFNRKMHGFNSVLDRFVLRPVAVGYDKVVPDQVQSGVSRFLANLRLPATAVNQALQGQPTNAGQSLGRFVVNTTVGVAGVFDPATRFGMPKRDGEDFGQTLATWGWRDSSYLVMPLLGPRTVRDTIAIIGDSPLSPIGQIDSAGVADTLQILQMVDGRAKMLPKDQARKGAADDYAFVRDAWVQRRIRQIGPELGKNGD